MTWEEKDVAVATYWASKRVQEVRGALSDHDADIRKEQRLFELECRCCFYLAGVLAGVKPIQEFALYTCMRCGEKSLYDHTNVPKLCRTCATKHNLCARCGAKR